MSINWTLEMVNFFQISTALRLLACVLKKEESSPLSLTHRLTTPSMKPSFADTFFHTRWVTYIQSMNEFAYNYKTS